MISDYNVQNRHKKRLCSFFCITLIISLFSVSEKIRVDNTFLTALLVWVDPGIVVDPARAGPLIVRSSFRVFAGPGMVVNVQGRTDYAFQAGFMNQSIRMKEQFIY